MKRNSCRQEMIGKTFGRLTVEALSQDKDGRALKYDCRCACGNRVSVRGTSLRNGHTKSCGCMQREIAQNVGSSIKTHGLRHTRVYGIWAGMIQRCENKNRNNYQNYGGRGISVCDEWRNSFEKFYKWAIENGYSDNLTIDRIENDKGYCPENCRWVTNSEQQNNTRKNIKIEVNGQLVSPKEAARMQGISLDAVYKRNRKKVMPHD